MTDEKLKKRVVITVDDESSIRRMIVKQLENTVDVVLEAENGEAALKILEKENVDLAIIDQYMPGLVGLDLVEIINKKHPDVVCIMLTGHGDMSMVKSALRLQVFDFLEKPFNRDQLIERVVNGLKFKDESMNKLTSNQEELIQALKRKNKVLNCIYNFSRILDSNEDNEGCKFKEIVKNIRYGFESPDILHARLTIDEVVYKNSDFSETNNLLCETIKLANTVIGKLEVFYETVAEKFTDDEIKLIKTLSNGLENTLAATRLEHTLENIKAKNLKDQKKIEEKNVAIKVILEQLDDEKNQVKENVALNIEGNIKPLLKKLQSQQSSNSDFKKLEIIEGFLNDINHDFYKNTANLHFNLTPSEIRVCHLVKTGLVNKEVAEMLDISLNTVKNHIRSIRKKLGLTNTKESLINYFNSLSKDT
jgi:DNA-binding NarL/FixJ family response regulator